MYGRSLPLLVAIFFSACGGASAALETQSLGAEAPLEKFWRSAGGTWQGENTLWMKYPENPQTSPAGAVVSANKIVYTWAYQEQPQTGTMLFSAAGDALQTLWTDSWHSKEQRTWTASEADGVLTVSGDYAVKEGPDWSWRIEVRKEAPDRLSIKMYNILPDGVFPDQQPRELLAVKMDLVRSASN